MANCKKFSMLPVEGHFVILALLYLVQKVSCSGPDFSDIRFLGNKGYQHASRGLYQKVYGGHGKRYGVHFPGPNEGYGLHNAHDKDPGGIDYKEFGWNPRKYLYPHILPKGHHYDGNLIYDDPSRSSHLEEKDKPKINLYIYNFDKNLPRRPKTVKGKKGRGKSRRRWRKVQPKEKLPHHFEDPYDKYAPVEKDYAHYYGFKLQEKPEEPDKKTEHKLDEHAPEKVEKDTKDSATEDKVTDDEQDRLFSGLSDADYEDMVQAKTKLSKTYDVSAGACGYIEKTKGHCWGKQPQLYRHPNPECYIQCDNMGNTFIRMCAKGTIWRARDYAAYNACV